MKKTLLTIALLLVVAIGGFVGYMYVTQPELGEVPPIPPAKSSQAAPASTTQTPVETANADASTPVDPAAVETPTPPETDQADVADKQNVLLIEIAGQANGVIEILLNTEAAPGHVARIKALAAAGSYDNVVFHRVIDGFMAQTGDVEFGKLNGGSLGRAGMGGSGMADLKAEFSKQMFAKGVVGMARSQNPDSANSQFFIMFGPAPYLNGQYTVVGRVIAGFDVVEAIKKGDANLNGKVAEPDYMKSVRLKSGG